MKFISNRSLCSILLALLLTLMLLLLIFPGNTLAVFSAPGAELNTFSWNGDADDKAAAAIIDATQNNTRKNASGPKIASNAHSKEFPGIYFIWDAKHDDSGYLKVSADLFDEYANFVLTLKESDTYWDLLIEVMPGQQKTADNCYVFFIPMACGNNRINKVFISVGAELPVIETQPAGGIFKIGEIISLSVSAHSSDGGDISYQWYSNITDSTIGATEISGETSDEYYPITSAAGTTYYFVVVTNTLSSLNGDKTAQTFSEVVEVTVQEPNSAITFLTVSYTYDSLNRLKTAVYPSGEVISYTYDAGGNLTRKTIEKYPDR